MQKLDIPEDIFGHQICLRKECWKLQRKKKRSQNRYAKIGYPRRYIWTSNMS